MREMQCDNRWWLGFYLGVFVASVTRDIYDGGWYWVAFDLVGWLIAVAFIRAIDRAETRKRQGSAA